MGLEVASYISELVATNPVSSDGLSQSDDHHRLIKTVLQTQFPNLGAAAVTPTAAELNYVDGVTSAIQTQLNTLDTGKLSTSAAIGRWVLIKSSSAASASAVDFINGTGGVVINSTYDAYLIEIVGLVSGGGILWLRTTTNASTFDSTSGHYKFNVSRGSSTTVDGGTGTAIQLTFDSASSSATTSINGQVFFYSPAVAQPSQFVWALANGDGTQPLPTSGQGYRNTAADIDGFRILTSTGSTFTAGTVNLYGRVKS